METWDLMQVLLAGALAFFVVWRLMPGIKREFEKSRKEPGTGKQEENRKAAADWQGLLLPLGAVVLFVIFMIVFTRG